MNNVLAAVIGIAAIALIVGMSGIPAMAGKGYGLNMMNSNTGIIGVSSGMMGNGMVHGSGNFDMNQMHRLMHGEDPDVDMNAMHQRVLSGNLTQEDLNEMKEHCLMMR